LDLPQEYTAAVCSNILDIRSRASENAAYFSIQSASPAGFSRQKNRPGQSTGAADGKYDFVMICIMYNLLRRLHNRGS
jgi:hypothetical protein